MNFLQNKYMKINTLSESYFLTVVTPKVVVISDDMSQIMSKLNLYLPF